MRVEILHGHAVIGRSELDRLDPPMGVATGFLEPTDHYDPMRHAGDIEGLDNQHAAESMFSVRGSDGKVVECSGVWIRDYREALGEIEVDVIGIPYQEYEAHFGTHPHYTDYWRRS
jgi:hypothetical protein